MSFSSATDTEGANVVARFSSETDAREPVFTRYLYEYSHVKYSMAGAILDGEREEALFWAYELFHSGFQEDVWDLVIEIYQMYFETHNPRFQTWLDKFYAEWKTEGNICALGSAVGTMALRKWQTDDDRYSEKFVVLCREDRHKTEPPTFSSATSNVVARISKGYKYLAKVSKYGVRAEAQRIAERLHGLSVESVREAYLGGNWLYYCRKSPIWFNRICIGRGVVDDLGKKIVFETDDDLEGFYEMWGFEPDEQCKEMHFCHGIYEMENEEKSEKLA